MADIEHDASEDGVDQEGVLDLNFVPDWARKPPAPTRWQDEGPRRGGRGRDDHRGDYRRGGRDRRDDRRPKGRGDRGARPPRRDARDDGRRGPRPAGGSDGGPPPQPGAAPDQGRRPYPPRHDQAPRGRDDQRGAPRPYRAPHPPRLPLDIRIIPDQKGVQAVAHRVHHSWMAYPVMDLATIFLTRPELTRIRIELTQMEDGLSLHQCQVCGAASLDADAVMSHLIADHLEYYFEKEEKMADPPTGAFVCVARCGLSGELLAPPNHHSYAQRVQEVHDSRCPGMDMESYRRRIETVRDPEAIEQWRKESCKQTVYRRKEVPEGEEAPELQRDEAIAAFRTEVAGTLIRRSRKVSIPAPVALHMHDIPIRSVIRSLWEEEERFPLKISFALRAAFRHMHLHVFKAGQGIHFVTRVEPGALDPEHVVEGIREVLLFLHDHPGSSRAQLVEGLRPGSEQESEAAHDVLSPLSWLIERGHIIEFFNGTLAVPLNRRTTPAVRSKSKSRGRRGRNNA